MTQFDIATETNFFINQQPIYQMKKTILFLGLLIGNLASFAQFDANNIVVSQLVDAATKGTPLSLVEYSTEGVLKKSTGVGNNNFYVGGATGSAGEGLLNLSSDGKFLTLFGYSNISPTSVGPSNNTAIENKRALAIINENGSQNIFSFNDIHSGQAAKSALAIPLTENTYSVYLAGSGTGAVTGVQYINYDIINNTLNTPISLAKVNTRSIKTFNNQLYISSSFNTTRLLKVGTGNPTITGQTSTNLPGNVISELEIPNDFVLFGNNLLYIAEENATTGGIKKLYFDGTEWKLAGIIESGITNDFGFRGLTGRLENGKIVLYGITSSNLNNCIIKIVDETTVNTPIDRCAVGINVKVLARSGATSGFRGIAFTPGSAVTLPISLASFTAKAINGVVNLNWQTSFEENTSHFEILRSIDGKEFLKIGEMNANRISSSTKSYAFSDSKAFNGINYYLLKQVDLDGKHKDYGPVKVNLSLAEKDCIIILSNNSIDIKMFIREKSPINLEVINIGGQKVYQNKLKLDYGHNDISIPINLLSGTYIVKVISGKEIINQKVIKY